MRKDIGKGTRLSSLIGTFLCQNRVTITLYDNYGDDDDRGDIYTAMSPVIILVPTLVGVALIISVGMVLVLTTVMCSKQRRKVYISQTVRDGEGRIFHMEHVPNPQ